MLKIRIIAALIATVLTIITALLLPYLYGVLTHWLATLSAEQKQWFSYSQIVLGAVLAGLSYKMWKAKN